MSKWSIEIITNDNNQNVIIMEAEFISKHSFDTIVVDEKSWKLPNIKGLSFGEIEQEK